MKRILDIIACTAILAGAVMMTASCSEKETVSDAKTILLNAIAEAENLLATSEEGTEEGEYAPGSKAELQARVDQAYFIMENTGSDEAYTNALNTLKSAIETFKVNIVKAGIPHFSYGSFINIGPESEYNLADGFTIQCRVRFDDLSAQRYIFSTEGSKQGFVCRTYSQAGGFYLQSTVYTTGWMGSAKVVASDGPLETGRWYHVTMVYQPVVGGTQGYSYTYLDGDIDSKESVTGLGKPVVTSQWDIHFGASACYPDRHLEGNIRDIAIWEGVRTEEQIQADPDATITGTEEGLLAYWPLDLNSGTEITDETGNHTARLTSIVWDDAE